MEHFDITPYVHRILEGLKQYPSSTRFNKSDLPSVFTYILSKSGLLSKSGMHTSTVLSTASGTSSWYFDSACCNHMTSDPNIFSTKSTDSRTPAIHIADGSKMHVTHVGHVSTPNMSLSDVYLVPNLALNLISIGQLCELSLTITFSSNGCQVQDPRTRQTLGIGYSSELTQTVNPEVPVLFEDPAPTPFGSSLPKTSHFSPSQEPSNALLPTDQDVAPPLRRFDRVRELPVHLRAQPLFSFTDNSADSIRHALQKLISEEELRGQLVQFWAATKTSEGRTLLTTQFQPFALGQTYFTSSRNVLCEYRMGMCREYNSFYADAESGEDQLGLPGRVFLHQLPESTPDVRYYSLEEYPQREFALRCGIESSMAVPVFEHSSHTCVGVLEIVSPLSFLFPVLNDKSFLGKMYDIFQEVGLQCFDGYKHSELQIGDENKAGAFQELKTVLETVCKIHELPLAMTWVTCCACKSLLRGKLLSEGVEIFQPQTFDQYRFIQFSKFSHLTTGVVAGMVHSSSNILYCSDITQLSLAEYPLVPYARLCKFRGWFTICLQSNYTANDLYVLEFFLPRSYRDRDNSKKKNRSGKNRYHDNSWTLLSLILGTMEENFRTFKLASGQELGDLLSVKVMHFQKGRKLPSCTKIQAEGGGVRLHIHSGMNVVSEDQNIPHLEAVQNGEVTMQLDSSHQPPLDPPNNGQHVVIAEQNISTITSLEERKRKTQRVDKGTGVRIEVPLADILKCAKMSRADAVEELQVSVSTLKRVCRGYGIGRWSAREIKKVYSFQLENEGQTRQCLNSDLPLNQASDSVAHTKPAFQDAETVTIRAKYENNTIKFRLSLPSRLVALQQEVAKRLNLEAGTYYISACNYLLPGQFLSKGVEFCRDWKYQQTMFIEISNCSNLRTGVVAGMSSYTENEVHVLEFFLPWSSKNSWTSLSLILGTMEENFRTFKLASGQELGNVLSVEVMNFQNASDSVAHTKPAFQDAVTVTIRAKYENNTIKFRLSLPPRLVALQQEVAKRLDLEARTYYVRYKDEENELILIACDEDLEDCIHSFKSLGNTSVAVLLELK
ncbi:hypothetical protein RHGRI_006054 [Rhododendron griersonianum]|uniref:NIN-like protein n=1 Tax=Rhododendron griersonianum TaxID=479676 RepID=A0AAV6LGR0_9ERIC|nr:hypothetical protein RHGRI_006054 [Rhododendron griersonianum]